MWQNWNVIRVHALSARVPGKWLLAAPVIRFTMLADSKVRQRQCATQCGPQCDRNKHKILAPSRRALRSPHVQTEGQPRRVVMRDQWRGTLGRSTSTWRSNPARAILVNRRPAASRLRIRNRWSQAQQPDLWRPRCRNLFMTESAKPGNGQLNARQLAATELPVTQPGPATSQHVNRG
jgi:hypothetical protein